MARKGITPVIAVVLLLLITVGAVASAWGLYQEVIDDESQLDDLQAQQAAENTDLTFDSVYKNETNDTVMVSMRNTGDQAVDLYEDARIHVNTDETSDFLSPSDYQIIEDDADYKWNLDTVTENGCFGENDNVTIGSGAELTCDTGFDFPDAGDSVNFRLEYRQVSGYSWGFDCSPSTSDATFC